MKTKTPVIAASDLISLPDAAARLGVHFTTVYRWSQGRDGEPPRIYTVTIGGQRFTPISEVKRLQKELKDNEENVGR